MENIKPQVGMGATICHWTDRTACTIISVSTSGREVRVQYDHAKRIDKNGMSECQDYEYSPNPEGCVSTFTLRKNGRFVEKGSDMRGTGLGVGFRNQYYDYSF